MMFQIGVKGMSERSKLIPCIITFRKEGEGRWCSGGSVCVGGGGGTLIPTA